MSSANLIFFLFIDCLINRKRFSIIDSLQLLVRLLLIEIFFLTLIILLFSAFKLFDFNSSLTLWKWNRVLQFNKFNTSTASGMVFLNVKKASDKVWLVGLLYKMKALNLPYWIILAPIKSYLEERIFAMKIGNKHSITAGNTKLGVRTTTAQHSYGRLTET